MKNCFSSKTTPGMINLHSLVLQNFQDCSPVHGCTLVSPYLWISGKFMGHENVCMILPSVSHSNKLEILDQFLIV